MKKLRVYALSVTACLYLSAAVGLGQNLFPLISGPAPTASGPPGVVQAEFPHGINGADPPTQGEPPAAGGDIMITSLNDNNLGDDPTDGIITIHEARSYASSDKLRNRIYFWSGFGRVTAKYTGEYFFMGGGKDVFLGYDRFKFYGVWQGTASVSRVFNEGWILECADNAEIDHCYMGLDWDKKTPDPESRGYTGYISVDGKHCRVHDNIFCGAGNCDLYVGGEDNWVYSNVLGLKSDLLTPQPSLVDVGLWVGGKDNRIGDRSDGANHICAGKTCIVVEGQGHVVRSNVIGRNTGGMTCEYGVEIRPPPEGEGRTRDNYIGGPKQLEQGLTHNIISHFTEAGVYFHEKCNHNAMGGNLIGLTPTGHLALPRGKTGVIVGANTVGNEVGGSSPLYLNWIAGQTEQAILVQSGATKVQIQGCHTGFDADAKATHPGHGVVVDEGKDVLIGGLRQSAASDNGNLIGGCKKDAIHLDGCTGPITIQSNYVGVSPTGQTAMPNEGAAVQAIGSSNLYIGVDPPAASSVALKGAATRRNVFANCAKGVSVVGPAQDGVIGSSRIVGNHGDGVRLTGTAGKVTGFVVGSADAELEPNEIINNDGWGVALYGRLAYANEVAGNRIGVEATKGSWCGRARTVRGACSSPTGHTTTSSARRTCRQRATSPATAGRACCWTTAPMAT